MQETWYDPWVVEIPWRRAWQPTPVFWPGEFHGLFHGNQKSLTWLSHFHFHFSRFVKHLPCAWTLCQVARDTTVTKTKPQETDKFDKQSENCICVVRGMVPSACGSNGSKQKSSLFALSAHRPFQQRISYPIKLRTKLILSIPFINFCVILAFTSFRLKVLNLLILKI